jgi:hypothetical protein
MGYKQKSGPLQRAGYDKDATSPFPQVSKTQDTKWKLEALEQEAKGKIESDFAASVPKGLGATESSTYSVKPKQMKDDALTRGAKRITDYNQIDTTSGEQMPDYKAASYLTDEQTRADVEFESKFGSGAIGRHKIPRNASKKDIQTIKEMNIAATQGYKPKTTGIQPVSKDTSKKLQTFETTGKNMKTGEKRTYGTTRVLKTNAGYRKYEVGKPASKKQAFHRVDYSEDQMKSFFNQTSNVLKGSNPYLKRK